MGRILIWILLGWVAVVAFRSLGRRQRPAARAGAAAPSEPMVECANCGLNVPRSEAIADGARWFCSDEHRRLGDQRR